MKQAVAAQNKAEPDRLDAGTRLLGGQYVIQGHLQSGGFGITYRAVDSLSRHVVIKECFPGTLCTRDGLTVLPRTADLQAPFTALKNQFVREARQMAQLDHPNIVAVHQVFAENNTVYMALDEIEGVDFVDLRDTQAPRITRSFLQRILEQSLDVLTYLHDQELLHRDISPDNLMVDDTDYLTLIDFGAARYRTDGSTDALYAVKDGYSAPELYMAGRKQSDATDIYGLGATLHFLITGAAPPDCISRMRAMDAGQPDPYQPLAGSLPQFDGRVLTSIDRALSVIPAQRFASVTEWRAAVDLSPSTPRKPAASAAFGPKSEAEIALLVATTNAQLLEMNRDPGLHRGSSQSATDTVQAQTAPERRVVDIFGTPIDDLAAWMRENDAPPPDKVPGEHPPQARSAKFRKAKRANALSRLLARCMRLRTTNNTLQSTP